MGLAYARALAAKGYNLLLVSNREEELLAAKADLCAAYNVNVTTRFQDLARADAADQLFAWCTQELDILPNVVINNAGRTPMATSTHCGWGQPSAASATVPTAGCRICASRWCTANMLTFPAPCTP